MENLAIERGVSGMMLEVKKKKNSVILSKWVLGSVVILSLEMNHGFSSILTIFTMINLFKKKTLSQLSSASIWRFRSWRRQMRSCEGR